MDKPMCHTTGDKETKGSVEQQPLSMPYPLRNRISLIEQDIREQLSSGVESPKSSDRATSSHFTPRCSRGDSPEHQLRSLQFRECLKSGPFALAELLANNYDVIRSHKSVVDNECSIHSLPAEVLTIIFSHLTVKEISLNVAPVCRYWYLLAQSPVLWRSLTFKGQNVPLCEVRRLLKKSHLLSTLCLKDRYDVGKIISQICQTNRGIRSLAIHRIGGSKQLPFSWKTLKAKHLHQLLKRCPNITKLVLKDLTIRSRKFYQQLGHSLPNLTFLGLSHSNILNPSHISAVADSCKRLKVLWLSGDCQCGQSLDWEEAFQKLFRNLSGTLTHLQFDASKLSNSAFGDLSRCRELRVLNLHKAIHISTSALDAISSLKKLEYLNLHRCQYICGNERPYPFQNASFNLVYLSLPDCVFVNDTFAAVVSKHCPQLRGICLAFSHHISDRGVELIIKGCQQLHYLDIYFTASVRGHSFAMFPQYAAQLHVLLVEAFCDLEKENRIKWLIDSYPQVNVERAIKWLTGRKKCCAELKKLFSP